MSPQTSACKNLAGEQLSLLLTCPCTHLTILDLITTPKWYRGGILYTRNGDTHEASSITYLLSEIESSHGAGSRYRVPMLRTIDLGGRAHSSPVTELSTFLTVAWGFLDPEYEPQRLKPSVTVSGTQYPYPMISLSISTDDDDVRTHIAPLLPKGIVIRPSMFEPKLYISNYDDYSKPPLRIEEMRKLNAYLKLKLGSNHILQPCVTVFTENNDETKKGHIRSAVFNMLRNQ